MSNYQISQKITILHLKDDWEYTFEPDEYGTVCVTLTEGMQAMSGSVTNIHIPKDCIQHFINALEKLK